MNLLEKLTGPAPTTWHADELTNWRCQAEVSPGQWEPARPLGMFGLCLRHRIRLAWRVFTGEYDAVKWHSALPKRAPDSFLPNVAISQPEDRPTNA